MLTTQDALLRRLRRLARANGWSLQEDKGAGKGSHMRVTLRKGDETFQSTIPRKAATGTVRAIAKQLAIEPQDLR